MSIQIGIVLTVITVMTALLVKEVARPEIIVSFSVTVLLLLGIITPAEALRGFSNEGMVTIALLFIVAGVVQQSGLLNQIVQKILGNGTRPRLVLLRMMVPVTGMSAFMNNTPIVVMLMSYIRKWCSEHQISPSKFLLPLSYAAIFGGLITLIGTSTNLVVHGLMLENGMKGLAMFELAIVGVPAALLGIIYMMTIGYKLLPEKGTIEEALKESSREYLAEVVVEPDSVVIGKTIEEAGLRNLTGLYLIEIIRNHERITPVPFYEEIQSGDRLIFTGIVSTIVELQNMKGLRIETGSELNIDQLKNGHAQLVEAVVSHHSTLLHKSIKQNNFRSKYDAAVVAVHRNHERIQSKIGDIVLKPGDVLLLLVGKDFKKRWNQSNDFYLVSQIEKPNMIDSKKSKIAITSLVAMILLASFNILSLVEAAIVAVAILVLSKCITPEEMKKYIQFHVLLLIASSFGIGIALEKTGAAKWIASNMITIVDNFSMIGMLIVIYLLTNIFTEIITNSAAAVMMFPIATALANEAGADPMPFIITLAIAASASFVTPIGYQTNLIVYGPGGYQYKDYVKVGVPLSLIYMVVTVSIVNLVW
ncbi:SLC13 family permease [Microaerobacter geothermalis]|uniref:SLC13 family permease n=1 Tax=Microaerobacter geothermalis TaxID=674972 RepID=UPI001F2ED594|nr:SLC13 family permease [Microaerobacter geothermalis]MCF6093258.1 SLC13 family permease [Microaerobacter geothermalis]